MRNASKFQKGSGCYKCKCCGRSTRSTGRGDNEFLRLCVECYDMGGIENEIADGCCRVSEEASIAEIRALAAIIISKGGIPQSDYLE